MDYRADDAQHGRNARLVRGFAYPRLFFHGQQLQHRQAQQRPVQLDLGNLWSTATKLPSTIGLFQRSKLYFNSPAASVNRTGLLRCQFATTENIRDQVNFPATVVEAKQAQDQRRLLFLHGFIGPAVNDAILFPNDPQAFQQPNVAADAHQQAVTMLENAAPKVIPHKASIAAKQRRYREYLLLEHLLQMAALTGIGRSELPRPR